MKGKSAVDRAPPVDPGSRPAGDGEDLTLFGSVSKGKKGKAREGLGTVHLPDFSAVPPPPAGVYFGTSSWTYPGWTGQIYAHNYSGSRQSIPMLEEYVCCPLFSCVGVDSSFYRPPSVATLQSYKKVLPEGFKALGKVYDRITIRRFAFEGRDRKLAGTLNEDFLNAKLATEAVVRPWLEALGDNGGPLIFELQSMYPPDLPSPEVFGEELLAFFEALPREGRYCVEIRNPELLDPAYFAALRQAGVAHVFNSWSRMPRIGEQLEVPGSFSANFTVIRALLKKGRTYARAVDKFKPYDRIQEVQHEVRKDIAELIRLAVERGMKVYVLVNNRLEGNSPSTIIALREMVAEGS